MLAAGDLRAAARERIEDADGRRLDGGRLRRVRPRIAEPRAQEAAPAQRADLLQTDVTVGAVARIRALFLIPLADAEIDVVVLVDAGREAQRLIDRHRVIDVDVAVEAVGSLTRRQRFSARLAVAGRDVDVRRLRLTVVVEKNSERALVLDQRPVAC